MKIRPLLFVACIACDPGASPNNKLTTEATPKEVTPKKATAEDATSFIERVNADLKKLWVEWGRAEWVKSTYITDDTELLAADAHEKVMGYTAEAIKDATQYQDVASDPDTKRMLMLLRLSQSLPSPSDDAKRKKLAEIASKMEGMYGKGKYCKSAADCKDLGQLSQVIAESRNYDELLEAWNGWHTISKPIRPLYVEYVELANEGAKETGFADVSELWKSGYDMSPAQFEAETERLWQQVRPLYEQLHCYVRAKLSTKYKGQVTPDGKIPAHLLGNMWAQEWANVYPMVEPYPGVGDIDVTKALKAKKYEAKDMVKLGEKFFVSLGLDPLPDTFWQRSMFTQPKDRDVVCHASAWDVTYDNDLRIKMCIKIDEEDLITIHHELGHNYYYMYYHQLPVLYQNGAHDGFHEAIGDALALSVTPGYLKDLGILGSVEKNEKALINLQMKEALDKIAFLPFGRMIDQWRWDVFSGKITPENYNAGWWQLREKYQGIAAPDARSEEDFDPGAKYHIPANVSYVRYFLARILQFQFHQALCKAAGHQGAMHECSIYNSKEAGAKLKAMLSMGASKPWPDALEALTGTREMDAGPILAYFEPLSTWLTQQNQGKKCGW